MVMPAGMFLPKLLKSTRAELLRETDYILEAQHQVEQKREEGILNFKSWILNFEVLGSLRVLRVKTCNLRVTCKTRNPNWLMYGYAWARLRVFTRKLPSL